MTSEGERSEPSEESSGERSDPRDSEDDRPESSGNASGEGSEPRESEDRPEDIPLNIAGHDEEKRRRREAAEAEASMTEAEAATEEATDDVDREETSSDGADGATADGASETDDGEDAVLSSFDISRPGADDDEVEPVELLVQMAEDGEIDPWDIDVVTVTDKFLDRLDESDLRTGGRALFYASVLLRMKSDAMWNDEPDEEEWEEPEPWEVDGPVGEDGEPLVDPFDELEREMDRRIERKRARGMPETLDELVRDLRERERDTWWKESRTYDTSQSPSGYSRGTQTLDYHTGDDLRMDDEPTADDVTGTAHDEHMEDIINDVYVALQNHFDQGREEVLFAEIREAGGSVVNTFLGVLFLAHRGQIRLQQDDLFGDLWVQDPAAVPADEPVTAD